MRICFALLYYDRLDEDPEAYIRRKIIPGALPEALAARGHQVEVVVLFHTPAVIEKNGVTYRFVRSGMAGRWFSKAASLVVDHRSMLEPAAKCARMIRAFEPDFVHFFGTQLHLNLRLVLRAVSRTGARVIVHYHGGLPSRRGALRYLQRRNFAGVYRFLFPTDHHARPFVEGGLISDERAVLPIVTTSSTIQPRPREEARAETGMTGDPVFVWTARLNPVKDPATALRGFSRILDEWPRARLYLYFTEQTLLPDIVRSIRQRPELKKAVRIRGAVPVHRMELIYNSADFFLQSSLREVSGFALAEAMAAGVIPVVTDIPSFRSMTGGGRYGILFPPGDADALAGAVLSLRPSDRNGWPEKIRSHFQRKLSFPAIAARLESLYTAAG